MAEINNEIKYYVIGEERGAWTISDSDGTDMYYGYALFLGADTSEPVWRIRKETGTGTVIKVQWADGNGNYDNVWDDRASLTYK